jgi:hypothetical protein
VGHSQQIAAMPVELDGEKCGVQILARDDESPKY